MLICSPSVSVANVSVISATYENGQATCEFSFNTTSEQAANEPVPVVTNKNYYLTFAAGILRTGGGISREIVEYCEKIAFYVSK